MSYASVAQAAGELHTQRATPGSAILDSSEVAKLYRQLIAVTHRINVQLNPRKREPFFEPWDGTRTFPLYSWCINSQEGTLRLPFPLLAFSSLTIDGTSVGASLVGVSPASGVTPQTPYRLLYLTQNAMSGGYTWYNLVCRSSLCVTRTQTVQVTGTWGFHRDYAAAWQAADTLDGDIDSTTTTVTVHDVDGADYQGFTPRFSQGNLIKIDDEYMRVNDLDTTTNELTVQRAQNGTTGAAHSDTSTISVWYPEESIMRVTARQAAFLYARRGAYEVRQSDGGGGATMYPQDLLFEMIQTLQEYNL